MLRFRTCLLTCLILIGSSEFFGTESIRVYGQIVPTARKPVKVTPEVIAGMRKELGAIYKLKAKDVKAHPASAAFPGSVDAKAKRITRKVNIRFDPKRWRADWGYGNPRSNVWHSTGLYAAPGDVIRVKVGKALAGRGLYIRIGCHRDRLWRKKSWRRVPEVTRRWRVERETQEMASAFGGLVYVETPVGFGTDSFEVEISGAVATPYFKLGETDVGKWKKEIRHFPGRWAEFATEKLVITVPSAAARKVDDPTEVLKLWNRVMDAVADLAVWPRDRYRAERFVADVQISAGYMHSGYPLMTGLDVVDTFLNKERLEKNSHGGIWGFFHEIGHNHQSPDWTFSGTTEVTVNLFTLYVYHEVLRNMRPRAQLYGKRRERTLRRYLDGGADFEKWKRDPFLALLMYMQLQEAFGWEPFKKVFAKYLKVPREKKRWNNLRKHDEWMVRYSRQVGKNLGPFFQAWGVPTSEEARKSIEKLPKWMPKDWPVR